MALVNNLLKLADSQALVSKAIIGLVKYFKKEIICAMCDGMKSVTSTEKLNGIVQGLSGFLWEEQQDKHVPVLLEYFKPGTENRHKEMQLKVETKLLERILILVKTGLKPVMIKGTKWLVKNDDSILTALIKTLSIRLYQITQQKDILKYLVIVLLEGIIDEMEKSSEKSLTGLYAYVLG